VTPISAAAFARAAAQPAPRDDHARRLRPHPLLPVLDYKALARARKRWVGLSDFTAFQLAMLAKARAVTWAGPALLGDFGHRGFEDIDEVTLGTLPGRDVRCARDRRLSAMAVPAGVDARGTLWGGNLAMVQCLLGTPWFPKVEGRHPVPGGRRRASVPDRAHAHPAAARRRARRARGDPARPRSAAIGWPSNDARLRPARRGALAARADPHADHHRPAVRATNIPS
jgi:hypothetical protein